MPPIITMQLEIPQELQTALEQSILNQVQTSVTVAPDATIEPVTDDTGSPTPPAATANPAVELDADRVPWNEEFHATTKTKKNDGTWKLKKGCDKDAMENWKDQYQAAQTAHIEPREVTQNPENRQDPENPETSPVPQIPAAVPGPVVAAGGGVLPAVTPETPVAPVIDPAADQGAGPIPAFLQRGADGSLPQAAAPAQPAPTPAVQMPAVQPVAPPVSWDDMMTAYEDARQRVGDDAIAQYIGTIYTNAGVANPAQPDELATNETMRASVAAQFAALGSGAPNDLMAQPQAPAA